MLNVRRKNGRRLRRPECCVCGQRRSVRDEVQVTVDGSIRHICRRCVAKVKRALEEKEKGRRIIG